MKVYDFDKTIYRFDSTRRFYFFCLKRHPRILRHIFCQFIFFVPFAFGLLEKTKFKEHFYVFFRSIPDIDLLVREFWDSEMCNIKQWYKPELDDVIISASPEFLVAEAARRLGVKHLIASKVDKRTGKYLGQNCYGEEKVIRFREEFGDAHGYSFYSDSLSDAPMTADAGESYIVTGDTLIRWSEYTLPTSKKLVHMFFFPQFMRFLFIGVINTFNGTLLSFLFSLFITDANLAFVCGYIVSLFINYLLNSYFTFKESFSFVKFLKFSISYIPNFIIQNAFVILFYNLMHLPKLLTYAMAAVIGIPVTFVMLKVFAFKKKEETTKGK